MDLDSKVLKVFSMVLVPFVLLIVVAGVWTCVQEVTGTSEAVTAGTIEGKTYGGNPCTYRLKVSNGDREASLPVPKDIFEQAEAGDWYDSDGVALAKASGEVVQVQAGDDADEGDPAYAEVPSAAPAIAALAAVI